MYRLFFLRSIAQFLYKFTCQFISWTNWVNFGEFMDNCWISCQAMADVKKVNEDLIIINLYILCILNLWRNTNVLNDVTAAPFSMCFFTAVSWEKTPKTVQLWCCYIAKLLVWHSNKLAVLDYPFHPLPCKKIVFKFITVIVVNSPERKLRKLAKLTSVHCLPKNLRHTGQNGL